MTKTLPRHFTAFWSADEEIQAHLEDTQVSDSGHINATSGMLVMTPGKAQPYKVVLAHENALDTEHPCATIREGQEIIRRNTPTPPARHDLDDQQEGSS